MNECDTRGGGVRTRRALIAKGRVPCAVRIVLEGSCFAGDAASSVTSSSPYIASR